MTRRTTTSPVARTRAAALAVTALAGLALTACGDDSSDSADDPSAGESSSSEDPTETPTEEPTESTTEPAGPACADVWVAGETLPAHLLLDFTHEMVGLVGHVLPCLPPAGCGALGVL